MCLTFVNNEHNTAMFATFQCLFVLDLGTEFGTEFWRQMSIKEERKEKKEFFSFMMEGQLEN